MTRKLAVTVSTVIASGILMIAFWRYSMGEGKTPTGQPPLVRVSESNLSSLKEAFNGSATSVRLLVMLSPT